jgi:hypothetical protein
MSKTQDHAQAELLMAAYLADLEAIVNIDSGTNLPQGVKKYTAIT